MTGHAPMASSRKARYHALMTAARFRLKRRHARWPGLWSRVEGRGLSARTGSAGLFVALDFQLSTLDRLHSYFTRGSSKV